jgi:hypothetical protein
MQGGQALLVVVIVVISSDDLLLVHLQFYMLHATLAEARHLFTNCTIEHDQTSVQTTWK